MFQALLYGLSEFEVNGFSAACSKRRSFHLFESEGLTL